MAPDVLGHRLVLSYEALAQGVDIDQVLARLLATVTAPRITPTQDGTAKPVPPAPDDRPHRRHRPRPQPAGGVSRTATPEPSGPGMPAGSAVTGPTTTSPLGDHAPDEVLRRLELAVTPAPRRPAAGRLPRPGARPRQRARRDPALRGRRRRPPHRLERHRPHAGAPRPRDDRRPRAGDLAARRPLPQPRLRHRPLHQARPGPRGRRRRGVPDRAGRQPGRRPHRHRATGSTTIPARGGRAHVRALLHRVITAPRRDGGGRTVLGEGHRPAGLAVGPAGAGRGRLRLPRPASRGNRRCAWSAPATSCWPSRCSTPASWSCPTSACWWSSTPRPGAVRAIRTGDARLRPRYAAAAQAQRGRERRRPCGAPGPTTWCCAPTATGWSTSCGSSALRRRRIDHLRRATAGAGS